MSLPRGAPGFSLVEVLCSVVILGVGLAGISEGIMLSLRLSKESERHSVAAGLASERIETLRAEGYLEEGEEEGDFEDFPAYSWRQTLEKTAIDGLFEVTVAVDVADTKEEVLELKTLLFEAPPVSSFGNEKAGGTGTGAKGAADGGPGSASRASPGYDRRRS